MIRLPPAAAGMRIGLFGGSFDPPHAGHLHVGRMALRRLRLDRLWWLVTPGNPLKERAGLPSLPERMAMARGLARDPRIAVTGFEAELPAPYTIETIRYLQRRLPGVRFVWIMGADGLASFDRWQDWREIAARVPIAVIDRPGRTLTAPASRAARVLAPARRPEHAAAALADMSPPAWIFLHGRRSPLSSTALRALRAGSGASRSG
ncbi:nicotinate-nucleotide adenylyltransferase [Salinarimonas ramus]|uniref:Probable nicotinate-nucleotide adenylyltransferase n=1 Tax=Salinarimonas ramus TaxID=690164 RepID=A0A917QAF3_9HYPH|nr:nicotinate-nucleotide adenylyltransferase [Salinarimonas ramus]GGK39131.1 putative nicotinate-nucleotide adenylyltransferase [Salinarimonas ramus]